MTVAACKRWAWKLVLSVAVLSNAVSSARAWDTGQHGHAFWHGAAVLFSLVSLIVATVRDEIEAGRVPVCAVRAAAHGRALVTDGREKKIITPC